MTFRQLIIVALFLIASPVWAQLRFEADVNCTPQGSALQSEVGRGCLLIEASMTAFVELRDALTANMPAAGGSNVTMTCTECSVAKGVTGCAAAGDEVVVSKRNAAVHRIACILTSHRDQDQLRSDVQAAEDNFTPGADIGDGNPG